MVWNLFRARRSRKPLRSRPAHKPRRLRVEALEDRYVLSTFHWFGNTDGNFNVAANWRDQNNQPGVPGPNDDAFIDGGGFNVTVPVSAAVNSLTDNARLVIPSGVTLTLANVTASSRLTQLVLNGSVHTASGFTTLTGGSAIAGDLDTAAGATLVFTSGTHNLNAGASLTGSGSSQIAGLVSVNVDLAVAADMELANNGEITGPAALTSSATFNWTGGNMTGTGATVLNGNVNISTENKKDLDRRTLTTTAKVTIDQSDDGPLDSGDGAIWNIPAGAVVDVQGSILIRLNGTGPGMTIHNQGTFQKSRGTGTADLQNITVNNDGLIDAQVGTLQIDSAGASTGSFSVEAGASLVFTRGTYTWNDGSSITGAGAATLASGTVAVQGAVTAQNIALAGGTLAGAGTLTVEGAFNWTNGGMSDVGSTVIDTGATLNISSGNEKFLGQRTLTTLGNTVIAPSGTGTIDTGNGAVWNNQGTIDDQGSLLIRYNFGTFPALTLNNTGTIQKSAGAGTTDFQQVIVNNDGLLDVQAGTVQLDEGGESTGSFTMEAGASLVFSRDTYTWNDGTSLSGAGAVTLAAGLVEVQGAVTAQNVNLAGGNLSGAGTLTVEGAFNWTNGGMSDDGELGVGTTVIDTSATLTISGGNDKFLGHRTLTTLGNTVITPNGTGIINTGNGAVWNNLATIDDQASLLIRYNFGTFPSLTLNNTGTIQKSAGAGTTDFQQVIVNNDGLLDVQAGTVQLDEGGECSGSFSVEAGANLLFTRNTYTMNDGSSFSGDGTVTLAAGVVAVQGSVMAQNITLAGGTLGGAGTLTVEGAFSWTSGGMSGLGTTYIDTSASLTISSGNSKGLDGRTLTTAGNTVIVPNGTGNLDTGNGAVWNNLATIDDQASLLIRYNFGTFPSLTLNNEGTFQKSAGTGATTFQNVIVNNDGEFDVLAGVVDLDGGGASTGTFNAAAGTMLQFSRNTYVLNAGSNLPGAGFVQVTGGTLSLNTQVSVANLAVVGGTLEIGNSGMLNVTGAYSQTTALVIHLIGTTPGAGYGQLNVGGTASISGSLTVVYDGDFQADVGESFQLVTFGNLNGSFSQLFLPGLAPNRHWTSGYDASGFTLMVVSG